MNTQTEKYFRIGDRVELVTNLTAMGGARRAHVNFGEVVNVTAHRVHVRNEHGNLRQYQMDGSETANNNLSPQRIELVHDVAALRAKLADLMNDHSYASVMDSGFDGGEFSGPVHAEMLQNALAAFQRINRLSDRQMSSLLNVGKLIT